MKINSNIQKIVDSKTRDCAGDAEAATTRHTWNARYARHAGDSWDTRYAYDFWCNGHALNAWYARRAWRHYENQF